MATEQKPPIDEDDTQAQLERSQAIISFSWLPLPASQGTAMPLQLVLNPDRRIVLLQGRDCQRAWRVRVAYVHNRDRQMQDL